jgi:hypothetical protein
VPWGSSGKGKQDARLLLVARVTRVLATHSCKHACTASRMRFDCGDCFARLLTDKGAGRVERRCSKYQSDAHETRLLELAAESAEAVGCSSPTSGRASDTAARARAEMPAACPVATSQHASGQHASSRQHARKQPASTQADRQHASCSQQAASTQAAASKQPPARKQQPAIKQPPART